MKKRVLLIFTSEDALYAVNLDSGCTVKDFDSESINEIVSLLVKIMSDKEILSDESLLEIAAKMQGYKGKNGITEFRNLKRLVLDADISQLSEILEKKINDTEIVNSIMSKIHDICYSDFVKFILKYERPDFDVVNVEFL